MKFEKVVLGLAVVALMLPMASYAGHGGQAGKGCMAGKGMCPMMIQGAEVKVENIAEGAVITVTAKDPEGVKKIQEQAKACQECRNTAGAKADDRVVCPVMGKKIDKSKAAAVREYKGQTYYLCCQQCIDAFDKDPEKYTRQK
jgi:YHS domain-containing protein